MSSDIDELKKQNLFLKDRMNELSDQGKIGLWELDIPNGKLYWSDYVYKLFEVDPKAFVGTVEFFLSHIHPEDVDAVNSAYDSSIINQEPYDIKHRLKLPDGRIKYVREKCRTTFNDKGDPLISYGTVQDITEETHRENLEAETEHRLFKMSQMAALGELASGIAHEINNPVAILKGYHNMKIKQLELCDECEFRKKLTFYVSKESLALDRIENIINSLKSYNHNASQEASIFCVSDELAGSIDFIKIVYESKGVLITSSFCEKSVYIKGFPNYFQQIMMNLYSNARDAVTGIENAEIKVSCVCDNENNRVKVIVSDNGVGIEESDIPKIFDLHFTTKPVGKGTGFGLHLVADFVKKMQGDIQVTSSHGKGTTFELSFPLAAPKKKEHIEIATPIDTSKTSEQLTKSFLVVDDEEAIAEYLATLLEDEGYDVEFVTSANEVLERIEKKKYDCIFTDIVMPEMNGQTLLRKLSQKKYPGKRVIVSGNFFPQAKSAVLNYDGNIDKPFTKDDVKAVLKKLFAVET